MTNKSRSTSYWHISHPLEAPVVVTPSPDEQSANIYPYGTFLCHNPPANISIDVDTSQSEYTLVIRLPHFTRDGITIAMERHGMLHIIADSWGPEGGHFERRVHFGRDVDLTQIRAEFSSEMLRIVAPRRSPSFGPY